MEGVGSTGREAGRPCSVTPGHADLQQACPADGKRGKRQGRWVLPNWIFGVSVSSSAKCQPLIRAQNRLTQSERHGKAVRPRSTAEEAGDASPSCPTLSGSDSPRAGPGEVSFLP